MRKRFKTLLCAAAIIGSVSSGIVWAQDADIVISGDDMREITEFYECSSVEVREKGTLNVTDTGILQVSNNLTNDNNVTNDGSISSGNLYNRNVIDNDGTLTTSVINNAVNAIIKGDAGKLTVNEGGSNAGSIRQAELKVKTDANSTGFTNTGSIIAKVTNGGSFTNNGTIGSQTDTTLNKDVINRGSLVNSKTISAANFTNETSGTVTNEKDASITVDNTMTNEGQIKNDGTIITEVLQNGATDNTTASIDGKGRLDFKQGYNYGNINQAIINQVEGSTFDNYGEITANEFNNNGGKFYSDGADSKLTMSGGTNKGSIASINGGSIYINGNYQNDGSLFINNSDFSLDKGLEITGSGLLGLQGTNNGTINQKKLSTSGDLENNGTITLTPVGDDIPDISDMDKGNGTFTNGEDYSITGTGSLEFDNGINEGEITQGSITINGTKALNGRTTAAGDDIHFVNQGDIKADNFYNKGNIDTEGYSYGSISVKNGSNTGIINQIKFTVENSSNANDKFTNRGTIAAEIENSGVFVNEGTIGEQDEEKDFTNSGTFTNSGDVYVKDLANSNTITNSATGNITTSGKLENTGTLNNNGTLNVTGNLTNTGANATVTNTKDIQVAGKFINEAVLKNSGNISIYGTNDSTMENSGSILNEGTISFTQIGGANNKLVNSGLIITNNGGAIQGAIVENTKVITAQNGSTLDFVSLDNNHDKGVINLVNGSFLNISNQADKLDGTINVVGNNTDPSATRQNEININGGNNEFIGNLIIGNNAGDNTNLTLSGVNLAKDAQLGIAQAGKLILTNDSTANLNQGDIVNGDIELQDGTVNLDNYTLVTGSKSTQKGGNQAHYSQMGGTLNLLNNSTLKLGDSGAMTGGDLNIDGTSKFLVTSEENGTIDSANFLDNLTIADGGLFGVMNSDLADYNIENINVDNGTANFTIDVYGRSNLDGYHGTDQFIGDKIDGNGTINIADWTLAGDIFGWQAPIDRDIKLNNVFDYNDISPNIQLTATKKEVFTPIGWYQLNNHGGMTGNYELNLTRFNPQVYRGQVTTLAQYMNQLAIDDMLFNHSMLLPSFKDDDLSDNGAMINRLAAANPVYAPYQYSKKDGGLWYRMYGTFETLQMSQGLSRVGNNAYGTIIGADFGLKDLRNGWKFMPTAYIGYNGAHQYFAGMGAYQNGGQAGFLGTWYKNNFVLGGLIYGGIYQNSMDIAGHVDNTFNYFAGASAKGAYNWRFHRDWVLQPNLMLAYNFFGQQNWHTDFGQMGMMSGTLNGINLAPGLNLIWEKETFSIYATLQYMYNLNGAVDGRAGNVSLPHLYMDRGYIQYGFGFTKRFTDRFAGYFQTVFRNVGRTGVGFQLGLNIKLGK